MKIFSATDDALVHDVFSTYVYVYVIRLWKCVIISYEKYYRCNNK